MKKFVIPILIVVMGISIIFAGCAGGAEEAEAEGTAPEAEEPGVEEAEALTPAPPKPGEWTASIEIGELSFTVSPDSTTIGKFVLDIPEGLECKNFPTLMSVETGEKKQYYITDGRFYAQFAPVVIQGEFDQTGTHASGTWEISYCGEPVSGDWEASPTP